MRIIICVRASDIIKGLDTGSQCQGASNKWIIVVTDSTSITIINHKR